MRTATLVSAFAFAMLWAPSWALAQSCPQLQLSNLSSAQNACAADCCSAMNSCNAAAGCTKGDWPNAVSGACAVCNQKFTTCTGFCLFEPAIRDRYLQLQSVPSCSPDCGAYSSSENLACGAPDGCGGVCTSESLCALLVQRPELYVVLF